MTNGPKNYVLQPPRDREEHLKVFLCHMHPILQRQQLDYRIIVVEQSKDEDFNRAGVSYVQLCHNGAYLYIHKCKHTHT